MAFLNSSISAALKLCEFCNLEVVIDPLLNMTFRMRSKVFVFSWIASPIPIEGYNYNLL